MSTQQLVNHTSNNFSVADNGMNTSEAHFNTKPSFTYLQEALQHMLQRPEHLQSPPSPVAFLFFLH